jgi:enterochelin esterase-like enzyme
MVPELVSVFGETVKPEDDVFCLLEAADPKPKLFICCGEKDELEFFPINKDLRNHAVKLGYDVSWQGDARYGHDWAYWDLMIQEVLDMLPEQTKPR